MHTDPTDSEMRNRMALDETRFYAIAKALADPRRLQILERIALQGECCCSAISADIPVAQPTISHHLKELANAGLIRQRREGTFTLCQVDAQTLNAYWQELRDRLCMNCAETQTP
ncbi:MAG: helix-turn-helix transcriptional regulator [Chthonomonadaceae bacterium]|nr:helix-turn-helix transcriptional regulator [Chthonomonadaceae bacterium]